MPAIYHEGSWLGNATDPEVLVKDTVGWTGKNRAYSQTNNTVIAHIENGITYDVSWTGAATVTLKKNSASGATITSGSTSPLSFTADADYELYFGSSATVTNIMVKDSRITDSTYEPYHESVQNQLNSVYENGVVNHLDNKATNRTISGITFTVDDNKIIYANGTSANSGDTPQIAMPVSLPKGRWAYSGCPDGGSDQKWNMILWDNTASSRLVEGSLFNSNDRLEFEITDANVNHSIDAYIRVKKGGVVCNNIAFKPMIAPASYTGHYVPYAMTNRELTEEKINIADLKTVVSASSDFADFKTRIASL